MAEEQFFPMFLEKVRESINALNPMDFQNSVFRDAYLSKWNGCQDVIQPNGAVVACDGSFGESSFSGGLVVIVARAIAHIYSLKGNVIKNVFEVDARADCKLHGKAGFMKTLELRVLRKALEKALEEHDEAFGVFDGSLYLTFIHHKEHLKKISWVFEKYVEELACLLKLIDKRVKIVGVSKDSDINYLRAKITANMMVKLCGESNSWISRRRSLKRILRDLRDGGWKKFDEPLRNSCMKELEQDFSDEGVYSELAPGPGFTTPLLLAPQTIFLSGEAGAKGWRDTKFRENIEGDPDLSGVLRRLDEYFSNTPIALTYWRPVGMTGVYRLDVPTSLLGYYGKCEDLSGDVFLEDEECLRNMRSIIGVLNWMRRGSHAVYPLVEVDSIAKLDRTLYKNTYEPVIVEELRKRGFKASPRRRSIRDAVLRGY